MRMLPLLLLLGSCAAPRPEPPPPPPEPAPTKEDVLPVLHALESGFYRHWGTIEKTSEFSLFRPEQVPVLRKIADSNGRYALMALRVLARIAPEEEFSDEARAILYVAVLKRETDFARWGVISESGFLPGVYGQELLDLGEVAVPHLQDLLRDRRRARVFAGRAEVTNRIQGDRVCDYAWIFIATILDRPLSYHPDPTRRDPQIRDLDLWLDRRR